jgi:DNA-binding transcriptional ArsR family regulator
MAQILGITPSAVSQHLKILRHAGLVRSQRKGFWIPYEVNQAALQQCGEIISNVCRCGCEESCLTADQAAGGEEISSREEEVAYLKKLEQELEEELRKVRNRMKRAAERE